MQVSLFDLTPRPEPAPVACRRQGHQRGAQTASRLHREMVAAYAADGPQTDAELAQRLGVERSTVNARRAELVKAGRVVAVGTRKNATTGVNNTTWSVV